MISKKEVEHIASLARLSLTEEEILHFQKNLSSILEYVEKIKEVDTSEIESCYQAFEETVDKESGKLVREDQVKEKDKEMTNRLLSAMPRKKGRFLKVKAVFN